MKGPRGDDRRKNHRWLVESRGKIQEVLLQVHECRPRWRIGHKGRRMSARRREEVWLWALLVGAAFSLWRAVFLVEGKEQRGWHPIQRDASYFLKELIETNAIGFSQDRRASRWSSAYYISNAYYRIEKAVALLAKGGLDLSSDPVIREFKNHLSKFARFPKQ